MSSGAAAATAAAIVANDGLGQDALAAPTTVAPAGGGTAWAGVAISITARNETEASAVNAERRSNVGTLSQSPEFVSHPHGTEV